MTTALGTGLRRATARLAPDPDPTPDGDLLARFLATRDEQAFALLVRRHGPMVLGTCRRVLGNAADADDAFQAAFVVLVRKAGSLTGRACVGNFLYGVAFHTALKARAMATKRRAKEAKATRPEQPDGGELSRVLDEELAKLPDKYREPVVLCELEGVSRKDAAARLGIPEGTISSRLATAHRMLAKRLTAKGFAAAGVTAVLANPASAVPETLAEAALRAALDGPPAAVTQLATEVSRMLLWNKLKATAVVAGVLLACGVGFGVMAKTFAADDKPAVKAPPPVNPDRKVGGEAKKDEDLIQGLWQAESMEMSGEKGPDEYVQKVQIRFKGGNITFLPDDRTHTFELEPKATPKAMNCTLGDGPDKGQKDECAIYELDGDSLRICLRTDGKGRPTEFKTAPNDRRQLIVLKRVKEKADVPKAKPPEKKPEGDKSYSLKDGEVLKLIPAPFPEERDHVFTLVNRNRSLAGGPKGYRMVIPADGADLRQCFAATSAENGWPLERAFTAILNIDPMDCVADDKLLATMFDADTLVRPDTPAEKLLPALQAELKAKCGIDVTLEFKQMEREVVVASGTYSKRAGPNQVEPRHVYTLDTDDPTGKPNWAAHVFNSGFLPAIGTYVRRPVVDETNIKSLPSIYFSLHEYHHQKPDDPKFKAPDAETVLKRLADQTGLTFKLEKRKVRALVVTKGADQKPEADKSYSLKGGEVLKLIPAPFAEERAKVFDRMPANKRTGSPADTNLLAVAVRPGQADEVSEFAARRRKDGEPVKPPQLLHYVQQLLRIDTAAVSDPNWLLESTVVDADVVLRTGAKPDELLAALGNELRAKCGADVTLAFREVETEVVVLGGKHTLERTHAFPGRPYNDAAWVRLTDQPLAQSGGRRTAQLPAALSTFLGRPVVDESDLTTNDVPVWITVPSYDTRPQAKDRDPEKVMKSFAVQTGLTFKLEKRKVKALVVTKAK